MKRVVKRGLTFAVQRLVEAMEGVELRASRQQSVMADLVNERDWLLRRVAVLESRLQRPFMDHFLDPAHTLVWPGKHRADGTREWNLAGPHAGAFNHTREQVMAALDYNMSLQDPMSERRQ
jgi:hypothetical protein